MSGREELAQRQAALVAALVAGSPVPPGFDETRVRASASALLRKRAGEVAAVWPMLSASFGPQWNIAFAAWAAARPPLGALRDGWDFARDATTPGGADAVTSAGIGPAAASELAEREVSWRYDGTTNPRRRRLPAARLVRGVVLVQILGRPFRIGGLHPPRPSI